MLPAIVDRLDRLRNTKLHSPQTNGFCERFRRTLEELRSTFAIR